MRIGCFGRKLFVIGKVAYGSADLALDDKSATLGNIEEYQFQCIFKPASIGWMECDDDLVWSGGTNES